MLTWDKGEKIRADLLDRSKAFYKVDRGILLNKVEYYGVWVKMFLLLKSYPTEINQMFCIWGNVSTYDNIDATAISLVIFDIWKLSAE